ncbi:hypothetical protein EGH90_11230 [Kaistella haifensis]|nr:hypothetical protein EGH90_11230 [Kaistella haifensis]
MLFSGYINQWLNLTKNGLKEEVIQINELLSIKSLKLKYYNNWKALVSTKLLYFQKYIIYTLDKYIISAEIAETASFAMFCNEQIS